MNSLTSPTRRINDGGYCSPKSSPIPFLQSRGEGVKAIARILEKNVLCFHDVENINQTYFAIGLVEMKFQSHFGNEISASYSEME